MIHFNIRPTVQFEVEEGNEIEIQLSELSNISRMSKQKSRELLFPCSKKRSDTIYLTEHFSIHGMVKRRRINYNTVVGSLVITYGSCNISAHDASPREIFNNNNPSNRRSDPVIN